MVEETDERETKPFKFVTGNGPLQYIVLELFAD